MLARTKFFLFLFIIQCPPSLLLPLAPKDVASNNNNLLVLETNQTEQIAPNNSKVIELIQQIDVKDNINKVISKINHVPLNDDSIVTISSKTIEINGTNNVVAKNATVATTNTSSSLLSTNTTGNALKDDINMVPESQNKLINGIQSNALSKNGTSLNTNLSYNLKESINLENVVTEVSILELLDGENILHEPKSKIAWRSDIPVKRKNNNESSINSNNNDLLDSNSNLSVVQDSKIDAGKDIFVLLNSGNIDGLSVNSQVYYDNFQTKIRNNAVETLNSSNSKLLNDLMNSTINRVLSNILQHNLTNLNSKRIFLLLNSGNISNIHISSPGLENIAKKSNLKDRSRRHLNDTNTMEAITLKPLNDKSTQIIDVQSSLKSSPPDNTTVTNPYATVDKISTEEISSAEAIAFRSLIPDKIRKLQQLSKAISTTVKPSTTNDHNLVLKLSPVSPPINIDLNQIPLNNLLGDALSFVKRLKRNAPEADTPLKTICKSIQIDERHTVKCNKSKSSNDLNIKLLKTTRKSLHDTISNILEQYDTVELVCPLSVIIKLYTHEVLSNLAKDNLHDTLNQILSSFMKGNEDAITVFSKELSELPLKLKFKLQLAHGKTQEFIELLSNTVYATLCSLS